MLAPLPVLYLDVIEGDGRFVRLDLDLDGIVDDSLDSNQHTHGFLLVFVFLLSSCD